MLDSALRQPSRTRRGRLGAVALAASAVSTALWAAPAPASAANLSASVTINNGTALRTVPSTLVGANLAIWDGLLSAPSTGTLMKNAGIKYLRYPGGSYADIYHWATNSAPGGGYIAANTDFDSFMTMANGAGASPIITANYGSGTPAEAAAWVRYANITKGYGVKYWEIGNEVYGNGHYGSKWENDTHADTSPTAYANNAVAFISAMKAVDPTIKVGVVSTTPDSWPDGQRAAGDGADWNNTVMGIVGSRADFVIPHWYPGGSSESDMLTKPQTLAGMISKLRTTMNSHGLNNSKIFATETNGGEPRTTQPQGLWAADSFLSAAEAGVDNLDWWNVHNGTGSSMTDSTGATSFNDEGMISTGSGGEPAAQTPFAPYYGIQMVSRVAAGGDTMVAASSNTAKVSVHAVRRAGGGLDVLLINKDNTNSYTVSLNVNGYSAASGSTLDTLALGAQGISTGAAGSSTSVTVGRYGLVAVHLRPAAGGSGASSGGVLRGAASNRCLDVPAASTTNGTQTTLYDCNGGANQSWNLTAGRQLQVYGGTKCLDAAAYGTTPGTQAVIWDCTGGTNQQWTVNSDGTVRNVLSGLCLDANLGGTANGTPVVLYTCNGGGNQRWTRS